MSRKKIRSRAWIDGEPTERTPYLPDWYYGPFGIHWLKSRGETRPCEFVSRSEFERRYGAISGKISVHPVTVNY